jgi:hypothetical protein
LGHESITTYAPIEYPEWVISVKFEAGELAQIAKVTREHDLMVTKFIRLATLAWCRGYETLESE